MSLRIIVLVKQVPDTHNVTGDAMKPDGTINRAALPTITNPEDLNALEEALKIKEVLNGTTITVITLGPPSAVRTLKECLCRGADDAILITDQKFAASDTLATSYALKCAIDKVAKYDLILCGRQAIDGDTAQVGPQIAEKLGINQLTFIDKVVAIDKDSITVRRVIEGGYEILRSKLPALLTVVAEANEPRAPSVKRVLAYKNLTCRSAESYNEAYMHVGAGELCTHIKEWHVEDIKADTELCGITGSPTKVKKIQNVVLTAAHHEAKAIENTDAAIKDLIRGLVAEHIIG
jgi:electron transfer flavoprotein beta subunit